MDKNTSISLHLAKVMGLIDPFISVNLIRHGETADRIFVPFDNRAQWADVVLWMITHSHDIACTDEELTENESEVMANILMASALATGWRDD